MKHGGGWSGMAHYRQVGEVPPKRHTQFRRPDGGLYSEELMGEEGFSADSALLYHRGIPSSLVDARPWALPDQSTIPPNRSRIAVQARWRSSWVWSGWK